MAWLSAIWEWIKKWGKWIGGAIIGLGGLIALKKLTDKDQDETSGLPGPDLTKAGKELQEKMVAADVERDIKLMELAEQHKDRLNALGKDQERELEALADKPIDEVVAWFDKL